MSTANVWRAKLMMPVGDNTQDHHCRMLDKTIDLKKTHEECDAAKGEWAKDADAKGSPRAH